MKTTDGRRLYAAVSLAVGFAFLIVFTGVSIVSKNWIFLFAASPITLYLVVTGFVFLNSSPGR